MGVIEERVFPTQVLTVKHGQVGRDQGKRKALVAYLRNVGMDLLLLAVRLARISFVG